MGGSSCTIFFDGRFWIALAEREGDSGSVSVARHVFGPEPSNPELKSFYLDLLSSLRYLSGEGLPRLERKKPPVDGRRSRCKALDAYKVLRATAGSEKRRLSRAERELEERARYSAKLAKRKRKKKGK